MIFNQRNTEIKIKLSAPKYQKIPIWVQNLPQLSHFWLPGLQISDPGSQKCARGRKFWAQTAKSV